MAFSDDLRSEVSKFFSQRWEIRDGLVVPNADNLKLANDGVQLDATVLYADLAESTALVDSKKAEFAAEIYKAFLRCACRIISDGGGEITAFDGDRVMAVFIGAAKNSSAVKTALKINWAVKNVVQTELNRQYPDAGYVVKHGCGIDTSKLLVARTGMRGSNDLVWVGPAANYAAKLSSLRDGGYSTWISSKIFDSLSNETKYSNGNLMWEPRTWKTYNKTVYCSSYWWTI